MRGRTAALAVFGLALAGPLVRGQSDPVSPASFLLPPVAADTPYASPTDPASAITTDRPPRAARLSVSRDAKPVAADVAERVHKSERPVDPPFRQDELFDHLNDGLRSRRTSVTRHPDRDDDAPSRRRSRSIGDEMKDIFTPEPGRDRFQGDRAFSCMVSPLSNPFLFEDPRALTEVRPILIYQSVPSEQVNFNGGNIWFFGTQGRIALTDRFSVTLHKLGFMSVNPGGGSVYGDEFGLSELWVGPKVTVVRNEEHGTLLAVGGIFQIPIGGGDVFQNTGSLTISPYATFARPFLKSRLGMFNFMANGGYSFSTNSQRSDYYWVSGHLDYDIGNSHRIYPLAELNWFQYTTDGTSWPITGEGRDLINFGGQAKGSNLLTGTLGGRMKLGGNKEIGAGYEFPLMGNKDFFKGRITVDFIWRY